MTREWFIAFCLVSWSGWRYHPGNAAKSFPTDAELVQRAEELWQLMQH